MKYIGIHPTHIAKEYSVLEYSHSRIFKGKEVKYYHVWTQDPDKVNPPFTDNIDKKKIKHFEDILGVDFKKPKKGDY